MMRHNGEIPTSSGEIHVVPVQTLVVADSPRLSGESRAHIELLLASAAELPPILVHRQTMRVLDGMHRLRVALLRGEREIPVRYFDGSDNEAFILAVQSNVRHGLPLSLADRTAAAERIVAACPQLSNRSIASSTGLSPKTIAAIRRRTNGDDLQLNARVGQDGKVRPVDYSAGRLLAAQLLEQNPDFSLRELAEAAGISLGTAHDVRERCRSGRDPVPARCRRDSAAKEQVKERIKEQPCVEATGPVASVAVRALGPAPAEWLLTLDRLKKDPSLRFSDTGRMLLRLLDAQALDGEQWDDLVSSVPAHRADAVVQLALDLSRNWQAFAEQVRKKMAQSA
ncbi:ParB N-terminal domain-containing protein [Streptomyces lomondensis]|uniref:ParB-like N-terminal domain-containing protein n=1 Tax=Streptomyces lomondensis TaxID=68229 RepID=A0ABQ2XF29_9ACTN|nr:ParB N-terminal domain-containing protein [Streptomyces lomondensis]MCF0077622.1 ParB N-terminal domain-containing protein [Streptomyces lomondensis]GGX13835.1 hypothetical protein GCM10010383_49860 [Streptomyces lomondensis]